jgi:phosphoserine aminotransferase
LTLRWIEKAGGLASLEKSHLAKAELLYNTLSASEHFYCPLKKEDRSILNAVFFLKDQNKEAAFLDICKQNGMIGVKGYRTVGGIRVSMYNAMPLSSVQAFCELIKNFS